MGIIKTFGAVFIINVIDYLLSPITTILVVKNLSVSDYGLLNWIAMLIGFISTFFTLGLGQYNYRRIPGRPIDEQYEIIGKSLFIEISFSLIGAIAIIFLMRNDLIKNGLLIFFFARLIFVVFNNELIRFLGFQKKNVLKSITAAIDAKVWFLPLLLFVLLKKISISTVFLSMLLGNAITLAILLSILNKKLLFKNFKIDKNFTKYSLKISLPLVLVDLGMYLQEMVSRYILKLHTSYEAIGLFSFTYSWFSIIFKFGMLFIYTLQPYFSESYYNFQKGDNSSLDNFIQQIKTGFRYSLAFLGGIMICFIMNYEDFIVIVGKEQYRGTKLLAWFLSPYPILMFVAYFNQILMVLKGKTLRLPLFYAISVLINVILNFILIPIYGYSIAGFVNTLSYLVLAILLSTQTKDPEFQFWLKGREFLLFAIFFGAIILFNLIGISFFNSFWIRMVFLFFTSILSLLIVVRKKDVAIFRSF